VDHGRRLFSTSAASPAQQWSGYASRQLQQRNTKTRPGLPPAWPLTTPLPRAAGGEAEGRPAAADQRLGPGRRAAGGYCLPSRRRPSKGLAILRFSALDTRIASRGTYDEASRGTYDVASSVRDVSPSHRLQPGETVISSGRRCLSQIPASRRASAFDTGCASLQVPSLHRTKRRTGAADLVTKRMVSWLTQE
jgi:hypothetical protein